MARQYNTEEENISYIADQICGMTDPKKRDELAAIKKASVLVHALVMKELDARRSMPLEKMASDDISPIRLATIVSAQMMDYSRGDLRKLALDIKNGFPRAEEAFHFAYSFMTGR